MNILIYDSHPLCYGIANHYNDGKNNVIIWHVAQKPAFDIFHEFKPDLFFVFSKDLNRALVKCITQYKTQTTVFLSAFGDKIDTVHQNVASLKERKMVEELSKLDNVKLVSFYNPEHNSKWKISIHYNHPYVDQKIFNKETMLDRVFECDVAIVEDYHPSYYNIKTKLLLSNKNIKFFANGWDTIQQLGYVNAPDLKYVFQQAKETLIFNRYGGIIESCLYSGGNPVAAIGDPLNLDEIVLKTYGETNAIY